MAAMKALKLSDKLPDGSDGMLNSLSESNLKAMAKGLGIMVEDSKNWVFATIGKIRMHQQMDAALLGFKKECEGLLSRHLAAMARVSLSPVLDVYRSTFVKKEALEFTKKCWENVQSTMTEVYDVQLDVVTDSVLAELKGKREEVPKPPASTIKPAGVEDIKPGISGNAGEPTLAVLSKIPVNADGYTSIFVGDVPMVVTDDQLRMMLGTKAQIERYHERAKFGYVKVLILNEDVDRVLKLELSMSGHKMRVAEWRCFKAPFSRARQSAFAYATNCRNGHRAVKSEAATAMKERACFVAEFLDAQVGPGGRRLYSQMVSKTAEARMKSMDKTAQRRMESMETAIKQILERLPKLRE